MYSYFSVFCIAFILFLIPKTAKAEFVRLREDKTKSCSLKLTKAKNIPHQCLVTTDESSPLEFWKNRISFNFGKISEQDFIFLKNTYSGWSSQQTSVSYNPNQSYKLIDFLPPFIQAFNGHRFIPESTTFENPSQDFLVNSDSSQQLKKYLFMNCWGLVYEVLRAAKDSAAEPTIFMAQGSLMLEQLLNNSEMLLALAEPSDFPIPERVTKPGDMILVMHTSSAGYKYLDHIAIAIDDGIYFEKAGTGENVPIRIVDEATLVKIWPPGVFNYELRRLTQNASLPHPQEIFSLRSLQIKEQFFPLTNIPSNIIQETSIAWDIESNSPLPTSWFYLMSISPLAIDETKKARLSDNLYKPLLLK